MILHQVVIRKDGPIHAVEYNSGLYAKHTLCGLPLSILTHPKRRRFAGPAQAFTGRCGRCTTSHRAQAA